MLKKLGFVKFTTGHGIYAREEGEEWINNALYFDDELLVWRKERSLMGVKECHAINTRVLIYNANKAVNSYGWGNCAFRLVPCKTPVWLRNLCFGRNTRAT